MTVPVPTLLTGSQNGSNLTVYTTASVSASTGDAIIVFTQFIGGARTVVVTLTTGGTAFTVQAEDWWNSGADEMGFHTLILGSAYTGTLTITGSGGGNQCHWSVIKLDAGTFNPSAIMPQWNSDFAASGGSFSANLASPVNSDSRTFCMAGHTVFEGTAEGPNMTQLSDSPGNSGGSPLGRGFEAAWRSDAFETTPILQGTSSVWGFLCVEIAGAVSGGTSYNDTVDISITSSQANSDVLAMLETTQVNIVSSQNNSDSRAMFETVQVTVASSQANSDSLAMTETSQVNINASLASTDSRAMVETAQVNATATLPSTDRAAFLDVVSVLANGSQLNSDQLAMLDLHSTLINSTVTVIDVYVDGSVSPFVILVGLLQTGWSVLGVKQPWQAASAIDQSEE